MKRTFTAADLNCMGGGGAGGRVSVHYNQTLFEGSVEAHGGTGHECGGAGIVLMHDTQNNSKALTVNNDNVCTPLSDTIDWTQLTDTHRGQLSFTTWIFDEPGFHDHFFTVSILHCAK